MSYVTFINQEEVKKYSIIGGQVDPDKLQGVIETVQETVVEDELGDALYQKVFDLLLNDEMDDSGNANYKKLWIDYIKKMQIYYTISEYLAIAGMRIENDGFVKSAPDGNLVVNTEERADAVERARKIADKYQRRLNDYLCDNSHLFPEYNDADLIYPNKRKSYTNFNF